MISQHIDNLLYQYQIGSMTLADIAKFHIRFELIHPFIDGNGRTGRLLMAHQAIANDFIPPLIENDHRREYLDALADAVELETFLEKSIDKSMKLIF
jgi:Fic family protein